MVEDRSTRDDRPVHLLLYGPPAVGKKTVGLAVSAISGYPLIDNHLTGDIGRRTFPADTRACAELADTLRIAIAYAAAKGGANIITTWMFDPAVDRPVVHRLAEAVDSGGGVLRRVRLIAPPTVLLSRVSDRSRLTKDAVHEPAELSRQFRQRKLFECIDGDDPVVDTSTCDASAVAAQVWDVTQSGLAAGRTDTA